MLLAEIHGKTLQVARDKEDYLTSTVFGHLRYVPPHHFWSAFFAAARTVPVPGSGETFLGPTLVAGGFDPMKYGRLEIRFWKPHPTLGEPDLLLLFSGGPQQPLAVLVEVKLWSGKSGTEEWDQLVRYLRVLDDLDAIGVNVLSNAGRYLVYLTPRDSFAEVEDSLACSAARKGDRGRLFRIRWQDVLVAARQSCGDAPEPAKTILADVATFLRRLGFEYFAGFNRVGGMPMLSESDGAIFRGQQVSDSLLTRLPELGLITTRRGSWAT